MTGLAVTRTKSHDHDLCLLFLSGGKQDVGCACQASQQSRRDAIHELPDNSQGQANRRQGGEVPEVASRRTWIGVEGLSAGSSFCTPFLCTWYESLYIGILYANLATSKFIVATKKNSYIPPSGDVKSQDYMFFVHLSQRGQWPRRGQWQGQQEQMQQTGSHPSWSSL